jgi:hypothetical protein
VRHALDCTAAARPHIGMRVHPDSGVSGRRTWQGDLVEWSPEDVVLAVHAALRWNDPGAPWTFQTAMLAGDGVLVVFQIGDDEYAVRYPFTDVPAGPNTGEPCDNPREWAEEIRLDMDEQTLTGGVSRAQRSARPNGLVELHWVW